MQLPIVERLKRELADLQYELSHQLPAKLEEARAHGDLRENAEYHAAKERQGLLRARIDQIHSRIRELAVYDLSRIPRDRIAYGSRVTLEDVDSGNSVEYRIVFPEEVDGATGMVSIGSPIGKALLNRGEGDEVTVVTPAGRKTYQVIAIVTLHAQVLTGG